MSIVLDSPTYYAAQAELVRDLNDLFGAFCRQHGLTPPRPSFEEKLADFAIDAMTFDFEVLSGEPQARRVDLQVYLQPLAA